MDEQTSQKTLLPATCNITRECFKDKAMTRSRRAGCSKENVLISQAFCRYTVLTDSNFASTSRLLVLHRNIKIVTVKTATVTCLEGKQRATWILRRDNEAGNPMIRFETRKHRNWLLPFLSILHTRPSTNRLTKQLDDSSPRTNPKGLDASQYSFPRWFYPFDGIEILRAYYSWYSIDESPKLLRVAIHRLST